LGGGETSRNTERRRKEHTGLRGGKFSGGGEGRGGTQIDAQHKNAEKKKGSTEDRRRRGEFNHNLGKRETEGK